MRSAGGRRSRGARSAARFRAPAGRRPRGSSPTARSRGAQVRVGVGVVVAPVVLVVASAGISRSSSARRSATPPGSYSIVVTATVEPTANTSPGRARTSRGASTLDPCGDIDDLPVPRGPQPHSAAVDRHRVIPSHPHAGEPALAELQDAGRRARRPADRASPSPTGSPSTRTAPLGEAPPRLRGRDPEGLRDQRRQVDRVAVGGQTTSAMSSGSSWRTCTWSKRASASAAAPASWKRSTSARASARLASRGPSAGSGAESSSSEYQSASDASGMLSVLP